MCVFSAAPQIVGGSLATLGQFPWYGLLRVYDGVTGDSAGMCGSSLISSTWALTAGHCVPWEIATKKFDLIVDFGTIVHYPTSTGSATRTVTPYRHEEFVSSSAYNDIALLKLESAVTFTDHIKAIALPSASVSTDPGTTVTVSGFGWVSDITQLTSNDLKYATILIIPNENCTAEYKNADKPFEPANMICARAPLNDQAHCEGDSGGALVLNAASSSATQIGIVSYAGVTCIGTSSVYTRVTSYTTWISKTMAQVDRTTTTAKTTTTKKIITKKTTTKKTTPTRRPSVPKCSTGYYKYMKTCCSPAPKDLVPSIRGYKTCANSNGFVAFNIFDLNNIQDVKTNIIDISNAQKLLKVVSKEGSFVSCFLNGNGVYVAGEIDTGALTTLLTKNQDVNGPWINIIAGAVSNCTDIISLYSIPSQVTYNKVTFDVRGYLMVQCVLFSTIEACPKRVTGSSCSKDYTLFDNCKGYFFMA
ncbi:testisin-like [Neocloeon triangulifer]|uniref:testisin-like n=1 Tax=Neocloeon triangulifer TaxID=2078957 RepID=UPI00286FAA5F|nr:testisin-like [Neocloeon triangulifer]